MTGFVPFQSTIWTVIRSAREDPAGAMNELVRLYREPVVRYLCGRGLDRAEAEDLAQEVFLRIFQKELLRQVERSRGRFRSFLLGVANNVLREHAERGRAGKRGGGARPVSLEDARLQVAAGEERAFAREWMLHLVRLAMERLAASGHAGVRRDLEIFRAQLSGRPSYDELAGRAGVTVTAVKNALHETRRRLRREVEALVNTYALSSEEYGEELAAFDAHAGG